MIDILHPNRRQLLEKWPIVNGFESISPWTTDSELAWLAEAAQQTGGIVGEIGSYKGKSAKALCVGARGPVICCDRFQDNTQADFMRNLDPELRSGKVLLYPMESAEAAEICRKREIRFSLFFIDGSHLKDDVMRDIVIWETLVAAGGILAFHDCHPGEPDNGISQALEETFPNYHLVIDSIACVRF